MRLGGKICNFSILTVPLHDLEELDNDLGAGANEHLPLATLLSVVDGLQAVSEDANADHSKKILNKLIQLENPRWKKSRIIGGGQEKSVRGGKGTDLADVGDEGKEGRKRERKNIFFFWKK